MAVEWRSMLPLLLALAVAAEPADSAAPAGPCPGHGTSVVVDTRAHLLWLCEGGRAVEWFEVAIGSNGTPKRIEGDSRTPLGTYPLGAPRPSARFGLFIPVGYPTPEQAREGFTGRNIGIHGPKRSFSLLRGAQAMLDWTRGCVAVATRREIDRIAAWVAEARPELVHLR